MHAIILRELESIEQLSDRVGTAVSIFGSARIKPGHEIFRLTHQIASGLSSEGYTVISGGGPGIMRAANEGARTGKTCTIGFNVVLPFESADFQFQDISLVFENFFTRKIAFCKHSRAFIAMPGGMGTLDELFEILTLKQTRKLKPVPVVLVGSQFWGGLIDWMRTNLESAGLISAGELDEIRIFDDVDSVVNYLKLRVPIPDTSITPLSLVRTGHATV
ncbi:MULTISPECIES: LOG family protein [Paraburkholderia]|uniref:Cytokinin riboside 5'-monophosphate phosphoribohydrolase n=1 Tax=Paraburkholderia podalyriae TaxID=1938811 RepID=A0ABR7PQZ3_9BURK|nr:TIGR00730 family Rossman fold protein [Paraburkholderia podalyriae]MBC8748677.1 TIGR00730 family Rossman fold protein [Paraburkholderia podalyriae]